jgi:hypothetical protein
MPFAQGQPLRRLQKAARTVSELLDIHGCTSVARRCRLTSAGAAP